jgi:hypothetical protein
MSHQSSAIVAAVLFALTACDASGTQVESTTTDAGSAGISSNAGDAGTLDIRLSGFTLTPAFSPDVHDYAVRCAAGANETTVTVTAGHGVSVAMLQPQQGSLARPVSLSLAENDAVVVETTAQGTKTDYWVRCLPHDFPQVSAQHYGHTTPGYYVTGNTSTGQGEGSYAMVLDGNVTPVWYRAMPTGTTVGLVTVVATDNIAYIAAAPGRFVTDPTSHFQIVDLDTRAEKSVATVGSPTDLHEFLPMANGDCMMLSFPATPGIDMQARGITNTTTIADCSVQEIAPDGTLVWSWLGSDHFDVVTESTELATGTIDGAAVIDPFHCNSLDLFSNGDILLSARQLDAVFRVSRTTGKVLWKLGGIPSNKDGAQILQMQGDPETSFYHQHDARLLPTGHITVFDDHTTQYDTQKPPADVARGLEIALDLVAGTGGPVFQYQATASAAATGSFRRAIDGSSVIGWGFLSGGPPTLAMTEVDEVGNARLEISFPLGDQTYRVLKVPTTSLDIDAMRATAGLQ